MAYDVTALPNYTEQPDTILYEKVFTESPILNTIKSNGNLMVGVKSAQTINMVTTEGVWQTQGCSFNASGDTTFSQRTVTVGKMKIDLEFCDRNLEPKFTQKRLAKGSDYDSLAYNTEIVDDTLQKLAKRQATAIWKGDTQSTDQYLKHFNGLIDLLAGETLGGTYSGTAWSKANSRTVMKGLAEKVLAAPDVWKGGNTNIKFYMNPTMLMQYRWKLVEDNLYHIDASNPNQKTYVEGTNIEIIPEIGLAGLDYIYAIEDENLYGATDLLSEEDKVDVWYSKDDRTIKLNIEWKFGINVAFPSRIFNYLGV